MHKHRWLWPFLILFTVAGILLPLSPLFRPVPSDDPSVYLYVGQTLLDGGAPYQDAWDHKQPLAFFLYALALILSPASLWGIWVLELVMLSTAGVLAYLLLVKITRPAMSGLSVALGMFGLVPILWGYSIEELSLVFQVFILFAFARYLLASRNRTRAALAFSMGAAAGILFFLKQSLIAPALAVSLYLLIHLLMRWEARKLAHLASLAGGFLLICGLVGFYLWSQGAVESYISAAVTFNLGYAGLGLLERFNAVLDALEYMGSIPLLWLTFVLWITCSGVAFLQAGPTLARWIRSRYVRTALLLVGVGLAVVSLGAELVGSQPGIGLAQRMALFASALLGISAALLGPGMRERLAVSLSNAPVLNHEGNSPHPREALFYTAALLFPLILVLMTLSGRNYVYYFIAFAPFFLLAFGLVSRLLLDLLQGSAARRVFYALLAGVGLAVIYNPALLLISGYQAQANPPLPPVIDYITARTTPDDAILAWGKDTTFVYFLSQRRAPSRYFYQAAIWQEAYNNRTGAARETLQDMRAHPPALFLIEGSRPDAENPTCPLPAGKKENTQEAIFAFVCERYELVDTADTFLIFALKN